MFSRILTKRFTTAYSVQIQSLKQALNSADAVVVGAGAGLSASAGLTYSGQRFEAHFKDFADKYGIEQLVENSLTIAPLRSLSSDPPNSLESDPLNSL